MFVLFSISSGLEIWSIDYISMYKNSDLSSFKKIKSLGKIFINWPNEILRINKYQTHESFS